MLLIGKILYLSHIICALTFASLFWIFADALTIRIEAKTLLKAAGFALLTIASIPIFPNGNMTFPYTDLTFYLAGIALWLIFISVMFDIHSKLQFLIISAVIATIFLKNHLLLATLSSLIAFTTLQIAYSKKHNDLIFFGIGFFIFAIADLFYYLANFPTFTNFQLAGSMLHVIASITLFAWLWQYLVVRYNLKRKARKLSAKTNVDQRDQDKEEMDY